MLFRGGAGGIIFKSKKSKKEIMKFDKIIYLYALVFLSCESEKTHIKEDSDIKVNSEIPQYKLEKNYHSYLISDAIFLLDSMDNILYTQFNDSELNIDNDVNVYNIIALSYMDSLHYYSDFNTTLSDSLLDPEIRNKYKLLQSKVVDNYTQLINNMDEINTLLYPQSTRIGYTERESILNFILFNYFKNEIQELIREYPSLN
jgi:hypothetical protein